MGNKANPKGLRLGIVRDWDTTWYAEKEYKKYVYEDFQLRNMIRDEFHKAGISKMQIKRKTDETTVIVTVARPGIIFGRTGIDIEVIKKQIGKKLGTKLEIRVIEEKEIDLSSRLLGEWITGQLEKRIPFRRAMKMTVQKGMRAGAVGIKVCCAGRLGGVEIARTEWYREGKVPLQTFRADIDYCFTEALTTYGKIGVKVWVYRGDIYEKNHRYSHEAEEAVNANEKEK